MTTANIESHAKAIPIDTIVSFIKMYRSMENSTYELGYKIIKLISGDDHKTYEHLCSHWKSKKKSFGSFFLNLSHKNQILLLHGWNIIDPEDKVYLELADSKNSDDVDVVKYFYSQLPPPTVYQLHQLLVFFLNHGVVTFAPYDKYPGLNLLVVPASLKKRYGNSTNWGNYILSLDNPRYVLDQIYQYNLVP